MGKGTGIKENADLDFVLISNKLGICEELKEMIDKIKEEII